MNRVLIITILTVMFSPKILAQGCSNPIEICGNTQVALQLDILSDFADLGGLDTCLTGANISVIRMHTTYLASDNGATISLSGLDCGGGTVQVLVVEPNALDPCNTLLYTSVSDCIETTQDVTFNTSNLFVNTDYLILLSTDSANFTNCSLTLEIFGDPLSINACCPINIQFQESASLEVLGGNPGLGYIWTPEDFIDNPSSYSITVSPPSTTLYEVTGFVEQCVYTDQVLVVVGTDIDVPNAFSPNDDGINDLWKISGLSSYSLSRLTLYSRWGQEVFRSIAYPQPWNGKFHGKPVPAGTYYYVIELNEPGVLLEPLTGHVAIIR